MFREFTGTGGREGTEGAGVRGGALLQGELSGLQSSGLCGRPWGRAVGAPR